MNLFLRIRGCPRSQNRDLGAPIFGTKPSGHRPTVGLHRSLFLRVTGMPTECGQFTTLGAVLNEFGIVHRVSGEEVQEALGTSGHFFSSRERRFWTPGSNGAGKSSLMRILSTLTLPTEGQVLWNQVDIVRYPNKLREVLGYLPQDFGVYPNLTSVEFLEYIAAAKGLGRKESIQRINDLLLLLNLDGVKDRPLLFFWWNETAGRHCTGTS